ncbi:hypothetical protein ONA91_13990 [Micromonospora sp. DR5-3]|uniref:hypothetical protein n=1 Tax=unclassified Micromonospora TaxID=2617518 RepID=UPI0011D8B242|nr:MULTISPECIES: hypothetical protein [unclassified Micromonospora]MCW3815566.1 hypothetical protein [Micromonospora sp. DR5-3]TYC19809.1 hypothetical protein FXF52_34525 [Micromonospora sp. MP36]
MNDLWDLPYPTIVAVGLVMAILLRRRLGTAAGAAITGFVILAVGYGAGLWWGYLLEEWSRTGGREQFGDGLPDITDYPPGLVAAALGLTLASAAGMALLVLSVVRGRSGQPPRDEVSAD